MCDALAKIRKLNVDVIQEHYGGWRIRRRQSYKYRSFLVKSKSPCMLKQTQTSRSAKTTPFPKEHYKSMFSWMFCIEVTFNNLNLTSYRKNVTSCHLYETSDLCQSRPIVSVTIPSPTVILKGIVPQTLFLPILIHSWFAVRLRPLMVLHYGDYFKMTPTDRRMGEERLVVITVGRTQPCQDYIRLYP